MEIKRAQIKLSNIEGFDSILQKLEDKLSNAFQKIS